MFYKMNKKYLLDVLPVLIVLKVKLIGFQEEKNLRIGCL